MGLVELLAVEIDRRHREQREDDQRYREWTRLDDALECGDWKEDERPHPRDSEPSPEPEDAEEKDDKASYRAREPGCLGDPPGDDGEDRFDVPAGDDVRDPG